MSWFLKFCMKVGGGNGNSSQENGKGKKYCNAYATTSIFTNFNCFASRTRTIVENTPWHYIIAFTLFFGQVSLAKPLARES